MLTSYLINRAIALNGHSEFITGKYGRLSDNMRTIGKVKSFRLSVLNSDDVRLIVETDHKGELYSLPTDQYIYGTKGES